MPWLPNFCKLLEKTNWNITNPITMRWYPASYGINLAFLDWASWSLRYITHSGFKHTHVTGGQVTCTGRMQYKLRCDGRRHTEFMMVPEQHSLISLFIDVQMSAVFRGEPPGDPGISCQHQRCCPPVFIMVCPLMEIARLLYVASSRADGSCHIPFWCLMKIHDMRCTATILFLTAMYVCI